VPTTSKRDAAFAECRSLGHEWHKGKPLGIGDESDRFSRPYGDANMVGIPSHCVNCGTDRMRWIGRSGESTTRYAYPDGYSRHGDEVLSAKEWRSTYVATLFADFHDAIKIINPRKRKAA
jgi:hypothetical protein